MKNIRTYCKAVLLLFLTASMVSCGEDDEDFIVPDSMTALDLVLSNPDFTSLRAAIELTNLESRFNNPTTETTIFAPDNDAFRDFLDSSDFNSLSEIPQDALRNLLLNHVVTGEITSNMFSSGYLKTQATNARGNNLDVYIDVSITGVFINDFSLITDPDNQVDNGVVHIIDDVIELSTITDLAASNGDFRILTDGLTDNDLDDDLDDESADLTVFAPSNAAFQALIDENPNDIFNDEDDVLNDSDILRILSYHVDARDALRETDFTNGIAINPLPAGTSFTIDTTGPNPVITDGQGRTIEIVATDVTAINGVIHVVDNVLLPR